MPSDPYTERLKRIKSRLGQEGGPSNADLRDKIAQVKGQHADRLDKSGGQGNGGGNGQPYTAPTPYSSAYDSTISAQTTARDQGLADIAGRRLGLSQSYGIGDTSNPYSQSRLLEINRENQTRATNTSMFAAGQGYSGAYNNAADFNRQQYGQAQDQLLRNYQAELGGLSAEENKLLQDYASGSLSAYQSRLEEALSEPPDPYEAPPEKGGKGGGKGNSGDRNSHEADRVESLKDKLEKAQKQERDNRADKIKKKLKEARG